MSSEEERIRRMGHPTIEDLRAKGFIPTEERLAKGPVAIFECVEPIPCNVCVFVCPFKAVKMDKITDLPTLDFERCTGCTVCVGRCPGQAIFVVDYSKPGDEGVLILQYDLADPPSKGEKVVLMDREGKELGYGEVLLTYKEKETKANVVYVKAPKKYLMDARAIRRVGD